MKQGFRLVLIGLVILLAACQSQPSADEAVAMLPDGSAERGAALFAESINGAPSCTTCHNLTGEQKIGPGLAGFGERAGSTVAGQSAAAYTYLSIFNPAAHIVTGYGNVMYTEYRSKLDEQQLADLMAYLLAQ